MSDEQKQAFDHYMKLYELFLSDCILEAARDWLAGEMAQMERDMQTAGLAKF